MTPIGFTHSEIHGSKDMCSSPWLIAACHVLRRLPVPRHPPCALTIFILDGSVHIYTARSSLRARSDAIFLKKKISSLSRYAAPKVREGGPSIPGTAPLGASKASAGNGRALP